MAETQAELNRRHHQRLKDQGLTRVQLWLHEDQLSALKSLATFHDMSLSRLVGVLLHNGISISDAQAKSREDSIPLEQLY